MFKKFLVVMLSLVMAVCCFAGCGNNGDATFPSETVNIVCPYTAGGGTDLLARAVSGNIQLDNDQAMIVTNIEGASGLTGSYEVYNSEPDGYNLAIIAPEAWAGQFLSGALTDDLARELTPVCQLGYDANVICVKADSEFETFDDLVAYAKEKGKDFKIASNTKGGSNEMFCYGLFDIAAGVEFTYVPYEGAAKARTAVLGGETECVMQQLPDVLALIEAGELRCLGIASETRNEAIPDVPTFIEQNYDIAFGIHRYIWAAPGTDAEIVSYLAEKIEEAMLTDAAKETLDTLGYSYAFEANEEVLKATTESVYESMTAWQEALAKASN